MLPRHMNLSCRKPLRAGIGALLIPLTLVAACARAGEAPAAPTPGADHPTRPAVDNRRLVRIGVLLPTGGPAYLKQYADAVLEGVEVAVAEASSDSRFRIERVVRTSGAGGAAAGVQALAGEGAVAIIAPLPDDQLLAAANARGTAALPLINPIGARALAASQVFALNVPDTLGSYALGEHAARRSLAPAGVLRARTPAAQAQARAFIAGYVAAGGRAPLDVTYDAGTTTFSAPLRRLRDARVRALFVSAEERDVRQIVPQVSYYGLEGVQVLATGTWATPDGIARIGRSTLEGALVTLPFLPEDSASGWQQFQRAYEAHFRRRLDNPMPALGYDAARLVLAGLGSRGTASEVAAALTAGGEVVGATGRLRTARGSVLRRPWIVRIRDGRLIPLSTTER